VLSLHTTAEQEASFKSSVTLLTLKFSLSLSHTHPLSLPGLTGGHYVAFAKNSSHSSWFEFNDTKVRPVSPDTVVNCEGYVLFYK
jgi:ubiquitin C-terminal hydrolase